MTDQLITIATYQLLGEAEAAKLRVEAEGVPVFLADAETVNMDWLLGNAVGYIKLQVPAAHAETAVAVLTQMQDERQARATERGESDDHAPEACLSCGKELPAEATRCPACGWSYDGEENPPIEREDNA